MANKTPIRTVFQSGSAKGLAEFQSGETIGPEHGGTGLSSLGAAGHSLVVAANGTHLTFSAAGSGSSPTKAEAVAANNALLSLINDKVSKAESVASNNSLKSLIDDRLQVANADTKFVQKSTTVTLAGDVTGSATLNSASVSITADIANSGVTAGTYGSSTLTPVIVVGLDGRITGLSTVATSGGGGSGGNVAGLNYFAANNTLRVVVSGDTGAYDVNINNFVSKSDAVASNNAVLALVNDKVSKAESVASNNAVLALVNDKVSKAESVASNNAIKTLIDDKVSKAESVASNNAIKTLIDDKVSKAESVASNNAIKALIDDKVSKAESVTSNNAIKSLIDDRLQVANASATFISKKTFEVVNSGYGAYRFSGLGTGEGFANSNPTIYLTRGETYKFSVNASGHPFYIKSVQGTGTGNQYANGVSGQGTQVGDVTFEVPMNAPQRLYYQCSSHNAMHGIIYIPSEKDFAYTSFQTKSDAVASNNAVLALVNDKVSKAESVTSNNAIKALIDDKVSKAESVASNNAIKALIDDKVSKAESVASNNAIKALIDDKVSKAESVTSNNAIKALIDDKVSKAESVASNNAIKALIDDKVSKAESVTSNNAIKALIDDKVSKAESVASNNAVLALVNDKVSKAESVTSNNAIKVLIDDRLQVANLQPKLDNYLQVSNAVLLTDIDVLTSSPSGNGSLSFNSSNGSFTFTPANATQGGGGGGASVTVSDSAPGSPSAGDLWFDSSTLQMFVYYSDGSSNQWVKSNPSGASVTLAPNRNRLINGNFDVAQRGTSITASGYTLDRWRLDHGGGTSATTTQQSFTLGQTDVPDNPEFYLRSVVTSDGSADSLAILSQRIEDVRTFSGQTVTVSFYAKADSAKNIAIEMRQDFGTGGSPSSQIAATTPQTVSLTTSWAKYTKTFSVSSISGKTLGSNNDDYFRLAFWLSGGSDYNSRTNSLAAQSGTFEFSQVQIEKGSSATDFEHKHLRETKNECYRYYQLYSRRSGTYNMITIGRAYSENNGTFRFHIAQEMRTAPSISFDSVGNLNIYSITNPNAGGGGAGTITALTSTGTYGPNHVQFGVTATGALSAGFGYMIELNNAPSDDRLIFDAEL